MTKHLWNENTDCNEYIHKTYCGSVMMVKKKKKKKQHLTFIFRKRDLLSWHQARQVAVSWRSRDSSTSFAVRNISMFTKSYKDKTQPIWEPAQNSYAMHRGSGDAPQSHFVWLAWLRCCNSHIVVSVPPSCGPCASSSKRWRWPAGRCYVPSDALCVACIT